MKAASAATAAALLAVAAAGGYGLGARSQVSGGNAPVAAAASAPAPRQPLYYRNPMGLADTSATPKKDPMGMDYIPVYPGDEESAPGQVRISAGKVQLLGVRTEAAAMRPLGSTVRAAGRIEPDERRIVAVSAKFEGYVERLDVNVTGQPVGKGQTLFEAWSPELVAAQREYAIAVEGRQAMHDAGAEAEAGMVRLAESSLARLRNWGLSPAQLSALTASGQVQRTIAFPSPVSGVVTEKKALQGMRFMPGEMLYRVTDLSSVWVIADLAEQDIRGVKVGAKARVTTTAYPGEVFDGHVATVSPAMQAETRTVQVRIEMPNPGLRLKPAMFAQVELAAGGQAPVLTVPDSAVIDTGTRSIVLVEVQEGRFEPREVTTGGRGAGRIEIIGGVSAGERVVVAANFLIDAESRLRAVTGPLGAPAAAASGAPRPGAPAAGASGDAPGGR